MKNQTKAPNGERLRLADVVPLDTPLIIQIFDIFACNLACKFCFHGMGEGMPQLSKVKVMDFGLFKKS